MIPEYWHELNDQQLANAVFETVNTIDNSRASARTIMGRCARLYTNADMTAFSSANSYTLKQMLQTVTGDSRISLNVVASCVDAVTSMVAKAEPRVEFMTSDGDDELQRRATNMTRYTDAVFFDNRVYESAQRAFLDACIFGTGLLKVFIQDGRIKVERVWMGDILVDPNDGIWSQPYEMHQRTRVQRWVLKKLYPEKVKEIDSIERVSGSSQSDDTVTVIESWRRPSKKGAKDGRHSICVQGATLFEEQWKRDWFPFAVVRWKPGQAGFYGMSLVYELERIQMSITEMARNIQQAQRMVAVPKVLVSSMSSVNLQHIDTNRIGDIIKYTGEPPQIYVPQATMPSDYFQHLWALYAKAYELSGISQLTASSQKPAGLNSGAALRAHQDTQSSRFSIVEKQYHQLFVDIAEIAIELSKEMYGGRKNVRVKGLDIGRHQVFHKELQWSDVDMDRDRFSMRPFPTNPMGNTPAGRLQSATELVQAGMFDRTTSLSLLVDMPDIQAIVERETAPLKAALACIRKMLDTGEYEPPDEFMDLQLCVKQAQLEYNKQLARPDVDDEKLELLRTYMRDAMRLIKQTQPPTPPPQGSAASATSPDLTTAGMAAVKLAG